MLKKKKGSAKRHLLIAKILTQVYVWIKQTHTFSKRFFVANFCGQLLQFYVYHYVFKHTYLGERFLQPVIKVKKHGLLHSICIKVE